MLSEIKTNKWIHIIVPVIIVICSIIALYKMPETKIYKSTLHSLESNNATVTEFTTSTIMTSVAISALPDDLGTPLANSMAGMNKYSIVMFISLLLQRLILVDGTTIALKILIPLGCVIYIVGFLSKKHFLQVIAYKIAILAIGIVVITPLTVKLSTGVSKDYTSYIEDTIECTSVDDNKNESDYSDNEKTFIEKIKDKIQNAFEEATDINNYKALFIRNISSLSILLFSMCITPLLVLILFIIIINTLYRCINKKVSKG